MRELSVLVATSVLPALPARALSPTAQAWYRVATLDSGKPLVDAAFGEVMVTCEKAVWLLQQGERWLRPERRSAGRMVRPALAADLPTEHLLA